MLQVVLIDRCEKAVHEFRLNEGMKASSHPVNSDLFDCLVDELVPSSEMGISAPSFGAGACRTSRFDRAGPHSCRASARQECGWPDLISRFQSSEAHPRTSEPAVAVRVLVEVLLMFGLRIPESAGQAGGGRWRRY